MTHELEGTYAVSDIVELMLPEVIEPPPVFLSTYVLLTASPPFWGAETFAILFPFMLTLSSAGWSSSCVLVLGLSLLVQSTFLIGLLLRSREVNRLKEPESRTFIVEAPSPRNSVISANAPSILASFLLISISMLIFDHLV